MHNPITTDIPARPPWLRWTTAIAAAAVMAIAAIQLARVDADLGAPFGPDRIVHALDASPALASTDAAQARLALRDRPVDGAAYRVLAQAEDAVGHADRAGALYATAVGRWPRDRIARAELADRAFAGEDIEAGLTHLDALLRVFSGSYSHSLQDSLYRMGTAALEAVPEIATITLACPNKHYLLANLSPFGLDNLNQVFVATDEPHGQIECTVGR